MSDKAWSADGVHVYEGKTAVAIFTHPDYAKRCVEAVNGTIEPVAVKRDRSIEIPDDIVWSVAQQGFYNDQSGRRITALDFYDRWSVYRDQFPQVPDTREIIARLQRNAQRKQEDR